jgi:hypothetical protein
MLRFRDIPPETPVSENCSCQIKRSIFGQRFISLASRSRASLVYQTTPSPALVMQYIQSWGGSGLVHETKAEPDIESGLQGCLSVPLTRLQTLLSSVAYICSTFFKQS